MCTWIAGARRASGSRKVRSRRTTPATKRHRRLVEQPPALFEAGVQQPTSHAHPADQACRSGALDELDKRERGRCQKHNPPHPERGGWCRGCDRMEIAGLEMLNGLIKPLHLIGQMIELAAAFQDAVYRRLW